MFVCVENIVRSWTFVHGCGKRASLPSSLSDLYPSLVSSPPHINYVATCPVPVFIDSAVVHQVLGALGPDFQDVFLPSDGQPLEAMTSYSL